MPENTRSVIYTIDGKLLTSGSITEQRIPFGTLPAAMYIVHLLNEEGTMIYSDRVVKE